MKKLQILPKIYATKHSALVKGKSAIIADLHIGVEKEMVREGVFFPSTQLKEMKEKLERLIKEFRIEKLIFAGDFKQDFSQASRQEWKETGELIRFLSGHLKELVFVRGNHDNYLKTIISRENVKVQGSANSGNLKSQTRSVNLKHKEMRASALDVSVRFFDDLYELDKDTAIIHGHKKLELNYKTIILSHEHPAIFLRDDIGAGMKIPCFLVKKGKPNIIVLPAFSPLAEGVDVVSTPENKFLSSYVRDNIDDFEVIGVEKELYKFPKVKELKKATQFPRQ